MHIIEYDNISWRPTRPLTPTTTPLPQNLGIMISQPPERLHLLISELAMGLAVWHYIIAVSGNIWVSDNVPMNYWLANRKFKSNRV